MLSHIRVLDLTDGGAALCGQILADLGADVLLIEPPGGCASRGRGPYSGDTPHPDASLPFWSVHRGKRSETVDLEAAAGRARLLELVAGADVLIEDAPPAARAGRGLAIDTLAAQRPELVHVSITPFGSIYSNSNAVHVTIFIF